MLSSKKFNWVALVGLLLSANLFAAEIPVWEKIGNDDEIEVFKKEIPDSPVVAFKGQGVIKAPIERVASILTDTTRATEWVHNLKEGKLIRKISNTEYISYSHIGTPIVMKDRDFVIHYKAKTDPVRNAFLIEMSSDLDPQAPVTDYVRGEILGSSYLLKPLNAKETYIIAEIHADPKGSVPKWIVNLFQKQWPHHTIEALREQAEKDDIVENPAIKKLVSNLKRGA